MSVWAIAGSLIAAAVAVFLWASGANPAVQMFYTLAVIIVAVAVPVKEEAADIVKHINEQRRKRGEPDFIR